MFVYICRCVHRYVYYVGYCVILYHSHLYEAPCCAAEDVTSRIGLAKQEELKDPTPSLLKGLLWGPKQLPILFLRVPLKGSLKGCYKGSIPLPA